jgi:hypothetical protein
MSYNLRPVRDPLLKALSRALPNELLRYVYLLAVTQPTPRYALRPCPRVRTGPAR